MYVKNSSETNKPKLNILLKIKKTYILKIYLNLKEIIAIYIKKEKQVIHLN